METPVHSAIRWKVVTESVRGKSHVRTGLPNQDACDSSQHGNTTILAVADGHGSSRHFRSQIGSALAVQCALTVLGSVARDGTLQDTAKQIENSWRAAVLADLERNPFTAAEWSTLAESTDGHLAVDAVQQAPVLAYGATLLAASASDTRIVLLQIGDGDVLAVSASGETTRPIPIDERLIGNQTTSLCQPDAYKEFRGVVLRLPEDCPALLLLSTDGYANSFRSDEGFLKTGSDYLQLIRERSIEKVAEELPAILSEATENGSADDITLGILEPSPSNFLAVPVPAENSSLAKGKTKTSLLLPVCVVALLAGALGFFWWQYHAARPAVQPDTASATSKPATAPLPAPALTNLPPAGTHWTLDSGSGGPIPLKAGAKISEKRIFPAASRKSVYAEVKEQNHELVLLNLSKDIWTLRRPGQDDRPVDQHQSFALAEDISVILRDKRVLRILLSGPAHE